MCREITKKRYGNVCYTCGLQNLAKSNWQTGHFIASSICSVELRFSLDNLRPQCATCNIWKSGNWLAFENHLLQEKGVEFVATLKQKNARTPEFAAKLKEELGDGIVEELFAKARKLTPNFNYQEIIDMYSPTLAQMK